jgi:putative copper resistance protein D
LSDIGFAALAAARWIHFAAVMLLFGAALFPFYAVPARMVSPQLPRPRFVLGLAATIALLSGVAWAAASLVNMTGELGSLFDPNALAAFLFETGFGKVWVLRLLLLVAVLVLAFIAGRDLSSRSAASAAMALLAGLMLVSQAWIGHPAASAPGERTLVIAGYALHVLGAGAWLGGLWPLWLILRATHAPRDQSVEFALRRFSTLGILAIALILLGGLVNAWARWQALDTLVASAWGRVLIFKILGFAALVALAAANRFVLMPRLAADSSARLRLARNVVAEQAIGLIILAAAAALGVLPPPA